MSQPQPPKPGDYVLATKFGDGDPCDHWAVGFVKRIMPYPGNGRFDVVGNDGQSFRGNGFRRAEVITADEGQRLLDQGQELERSTRRDRSMWDLLAALRGQEEPSVVRRLACRARLIALIRQHGNDDAKLSDILDALAAGDEEAIRVAEEFEKPEPQRTS